MKKFTLFFSALLFSMMSFAGVVTFDADADKGNAGTDSDNAAAYAITKDGVTVEVSSGILGTYNNEMHYRVYKNQTLTITSTVGNITSVELTCTANDDAKYGPGCFTVSTGDYTYSGPVGTWTGNATEITFTASANQVRATQIVVTIDGEGGSETPEQPEQPEEPETPDTPAPEGVITCAEALAICQATGETSTTETYTIRGYVTEFKETYNTQFGNATFWIADEQGGGQVILAFRVKPVNESDQAVNVNDYVEVVGTLVNYKGNTPEVNAGGTYTIVTAGEGGETPEQPEEPETPVTPEEPEAKVVTVAEFNAAPEATDVYYELTGTIGGTINTTYGNFDLTDETGTVYVYGLTKEFIAVGSTKNDQSYASLGLKEGDKITIRGFRGSYNGKIEVMGAYFVKLVEAGSGETPDQPEEPETPDTPVTPETPEGAIVFDADVDQGNAGTDSNNAAAYEVEKNGVTMTVSSGILGTFNNEVHYRIYKNQTLTLTSTVGNIVKVEFTCTADGDTKYGPGGFTVTEGEYGHTGGAVGTWTGSASEIVFSASVNQVRASQVVVTIEGGATPTDVVNVKDLPYADAYYIEEEGVAYWEFDLYKDFNEETYSYVYPEVLLGVVSNSKTAINGTYELIHAAYVTGEADEDYVDNESVGTLTIKKVDESNYSFVASFVGEDGKTYNINTVANVWAYDTTIEEEIELNEEGTDEPGDDPVTPPTPPTTDGAVTFDADVDQGNATTDYNLAGPFQVTKSGVALDVTKGCIGVYNNESHYRIYKSETLTLTSTVGKIVKVEFTCTANGEEKYGPGCFTVDGGEYTYSDAVGTWTGSADAIVFTATTNQVRATQVVVTLASTATGVEDVETVEVPVKVIENGQLMIIRGENVYNVLGAQVK